MFCPLYVQYSRSVGSVLDLGFKSSVQSYSSLCSFRQVIFQPNLVVKLKKENTTLSSLKVVMEM